MPLYPVEIEDPKKHPYIVEMLPEALFNLVPNCIEPNLKSRIEFLKGRNLFCASGPRILNQFFFKIMALSPVLPDLSSLSLH